MGSSGKLFTSADILDRTIQAGDIGLGTILGGVSGNLAGETVESLNILNGTIQTGDLAAGAASQSATVTIAPGGFTTSTSFVAMTGSSLALPANTVGPVLLVAMSNLYHTITDTQLWGGFAVDGAAQGLYWVAQSRGTGLFVPMTLVQLVVPSPGAHTFTIQWATQGGTVSQNGVTFSAIELKR